MDEQHYWWQVLAVMFGVSQKQNQNALNYVRLPNETTRGSSKEPRLKCRKVGEISSHQGRQRQTLVRHAPPGSSADTAAQIPSGSPEY